MPASRPRRRAPSSPGCRRQLDEIVGRALRKDPGERFQTAQEFAAALNALELGGDRQRRCRPRPRPAQTARPRPGWSWRAALRRAACGERRRGRECRRRGARRDRRHEGGRAPAVTRVVAGAGASGRAPRRGAAETAVTRAVAPDARDRRASPRRRRLWTAAGRSHRDRGRARGLLHLPRVGRPPRRDALRGRHDAGARDRPAARQGLCGAHRQRLLRRVCAGRRHGAAPRAGLVAQEGPADPPGRSAAVCCTRRS